MVQQLTKFSFVFNKQYMKTQTWSANIILIGLSFVLENIFSIA